MDVYFGARLNKLKTVSYVAFLVAPMNINLFYIHRCLMFYANISSFLVVIQS